MCTCVYCWYVSCVCVWGWVYLYVWYVCLYGVYICLYSVCIVDLCGGRCVRVHVVGVDILGDGLIDTIRSLSLVI